MTDGPHSDGEFPEDRDWIVRLARRKDGRKYYYRHDGNLTARRESSWRFDRETAEQLALAIRTNHRDFTAKAMRYASGRGCHIDTTCKIVETHLRRIPVHGGNLVRTLVEGLERAMCRDEGCHPRSDYAVIVDSDTFLRLRMESGRAAMCLPIDAQMKLAGAEIWVMRKMDGFAVARILERGSVE